MKYPIGIQSFNRIIEDDYVYVDKTALIHKQIEEKGYARPYEADNRPLYRIGVSFSSETGTVNDWKVK